MKIFKYLLSFALSLFALLYLSNTAYAAEDIDISKIEYLNNNVFKVAVNTNGEVVDGVTLVLNIDGDINISEITEGTTGLCDSFEYQQAEKSLSITCLEQAPKAVDGTIAEITATTGTSYSMKVSTDNSDFGGLETGNITDIDVNPAETEDNNINPDSNILLYVSAGVFLLFLVVLIILLQRKRNAIKSK